MPTRCRWPELVRQEAAPGFLSILDLLPYPSKNVPG
jgi:hypothetical protein